MTSTQTDRSDQAAAVTTGRGALRMFQQMQQHTPRVYAAEAERLGLPAANQPEPATVARVYLIGLRKHARTLPEIDHLTDAITAIDHVGVPVSHLNHLDVAAWLNQTAATDVDQNTWTVADLLGIDAEWGPNSADEDGWFNQITELFCSAVRAGHLPDGAIEIRRDGEGFPGWYWLSYDQPGEGRYLTPELSLYGLFDQLPDGSSTQLGVPLAVTVLSRLHAELALFRADPAAVLDDNREFWTGAR